MTANVGFVETAETHERDAEAFRLRSRRMSYAKIGVALGCDQATAYRAVQRAIARANRDSLQESKALILEHLDQLAQAAWAVLEADHIVVQNGKVVRMVDPATGEARPIKDSMPILQAIDRLIVIEREKIKIYGFYAPKQVQVFTHDSVDAAIQELERDIALRDAAARVDGSRPTGEAAVPAGAAGAQD